MLSGKQVQQTVGRDTLNGIFIFPKLALLVQSSKVLKLIDSVQHFNVSIFDFDFTKWSNTLKQLSAAAYELFKCLTI